MTTLAVRKRDAAQACVNRFMGRALVWGKDDCALLAKHDLHQMKIGVPFMKGVRWRSEANAVRVLRGVGFDGLLAAVDAVGLQRIPVAMATAADIVAFQVDGRMWDCALTIAVGEGRVLGFGPMGEEIRCGVVEPDLSTAICAWSVS